MMIDDYNLSEHMLDELREYNDCLERGGTDCAWFLRYLCHQSQHHDRADQDLAAEIWSGLPDDPKWPPLRDDPQ